MRTLVAAALLGLTFAAGCGGGSEELPVPDSDEPLMSYGRGGGFAGYSFGIEIRPDGIGTVETSAGLDQSTIEFELPEGELAELIEHLERSDVTNLDQGYDEDCADCFAYTLEFGEETASADSSTVTEEFFDAADPLEEVLERHLPPGAPY